MANLQVKDFPQKLYEQLTALAKREKRSISQQTILIIEKELVKNRSIKREVLYQQIADFAKQNHFKNDVTSWIREDRDA